MTIVLSPGRSLERLQHIADDGAGEVLRQAADGSAILLNEAIQVLGGLILLAEGQRIILVEDVSVSGGKDDLGSYSDQIARCLAAGGIVGERRDRLCEDRAREMRVRICVRPIQNHELRAGVEFANDSLGKVDFGREVLDTRGKDGDVHGACARRQVGRRTGDMIAASACRERCKGSKRQQQREGDLLHAGKSIVASGLRSPGAYRVGNRARQWQGWRIGEVSLRSGRTQIR